MRTVKICEAGMNEMLPDREERKGVKARDSKEREAWRERERKEICSGSLSVCPGASNNSSASRQTLFSLLHRKRRERELRNREGSPERCLLTRLCPAASCSRRPQRGAAEEVAPLFDPPCSALC